jgi:hypothetical protein
VLKKILPILLLLLSCSDVNDKLVEKKYKLGDIEVTQYEISLITSAHDHLDVTKDGKTIERILKVNTGAIDSVFLVKDTLVVKTSRWIVIYEKKDKAFNYFIKIDSAPHIVEDTIYGYPVTNNKRKVK